MSENYSLFTGDIRQQTWLAGRPAAKPDLDQRIATGFNRNHRGNTENDTDSDEYQVEYAVLPECGAIVALGRRVKILPT